MTIKIGHTKDHPGVSISMDGDDLAEVIMLGLACKGFWINGPRTVLIDGGLCRSRVCEIEVDPKGHVTSHGAVYEAKPKSEPKTKTATIARLHMFGTPRHILCILYQGAPQDLPVSGYPKTSIVHYTQDDINLIKAYAKQLGFTHVKVAGDWTRYTKPKGGKL